MPHTFDRKQWIVVDSLADIILENVEGCIVDIGFGMSTIVLADYAKKWGRKQYSCDISEKIINKYGGKLHDKHIIFVGKSLDFIASFNDIVALAFIDGEHIANTVRKEAIVLLDHMSTYGVLFLHDTFPPECLVRENGKKCGDVYKVRQEFERKGNLWCFTWPYVKQAEGCGLTMIMKKMQ